MKKLFTLIRRTAFIPALLIGYAATAQTTGSFNENITFMGATRQLSCFVSPSYNAAVPARLMIGLHGLGDNSNNYRNALVGSLGFEAAAPNTILICPDGGSDQLKDFYTPAGDEAIIQASIDYAVTHYNIDVTNIILQGFSLGGRSALRYGLGHTTQFKGLLLNTPAIQGVKEAVAQWGAGGLYDYAQAPQIPIYITHGNTDDNYRSPIDSTYEQLVRNNGMLQLVHFNGGHTIPPLSSIPNFNTFFTQPAAAGADVQVVKVTVAPRSCNTSVPAKILLQNTGTTPLTSVGFRYDWNGTPQHYTWNGTLASFAHAEIDLPAFTAAAGAHTLEVIADTLNGNLIDMIPGNDTSTADFRIATTPSSLPLTEKFDDDSYDDRWLTQPSGDFILPWSFDDAVHALFCFNSIFIFDNSQRKEEFLSPVVNLSSLSAPTLSFDVAFNYTTFTADFFGVDTTLSDTLQVLVSTDCGATYQSVYKKAGAALATFAQPIKNPASLNAYFISPADTNWRRETIDLSSFATSNDAVVKFRYISSLGGAIYLDNITLDKVTGIAAIERPKIALYPNPAHDQVNLSTGDALLQSVTISDLSGRVMMQVPGQGQKTATISTAALPNGVYFFLIATAKGSVNQKVVVQH